MGLECLKKSLPKSTCVLPLYPPTRTLQTMPKREQFWGLSPAHFHTLQPEASRNPTDTTRHSERELSQMLEMGGKTEQSSSPESLSKAPLVLVPGGDSLSISLWSPCKEQKRIEEGRAPGLKGANSSCSSIPTSTLQLDHWCETLPPAQITFPLHLPPIYPFLCVILHEHTWRERMWQTQLIFPPQLQTQCTPFNNNRKPQVY